MSRRIGQGRAFAIVVAAACFTPAASLAAPIALDGTAAGPVPTSNGLTSQSIPNFVVSDNPDRLLVVMIGGEYSSTTSSVTFGTQSFTRAADASGASSASLWYLLSPDAGTDTITANITSAGNGWTLSAASFYNVAQQAPTDIKQQFQSSATTSTLLVDVEPTGLIVESIGSNDMGSGGSITGGSGQTLFRNVNTTSSGGWSAGASYDLSFSGTPSSQQMTLTNSQRFAHVAVSFANVPEPATLGLLGVVGVGLLARRRAQRQ